MGLCRVIYKALMARSVQRRRRASLQWVAEQLTVSFEDYRRLVNAHPETRQALNYAAVWQEVRRLERAGYLASKKIHPSLPKYLYVTQKTLTELGLPFPEYEPRQLAEKRIRDKKTGATKQVLLGKAIYHTDAINKARLYFELVLHQSGWRSERWLRQDERQQDNMKRGHRIDALAIVNEKAIAIEVENSNKASQRLEDILLYHLMTFERSYYFCTNPATYSLIYRKTRELDPQGTHFKLFQPAQFM